MFRIYWSGLFVKKYVKYGQMILGYSSLFETKFLLSRLSPKFQTVTFFVWSDVWLQKLDKVFFLRLLIWQIHFFSFSSPWFIVAVPKEKYNYIIDIFSEPWKTEIFVETIAQIWKQFFFIWQKKCLLNQFFIEQKVNTDYLYVLRLKNDTKKTLQHIDFYSSLVIF